MSNRIQQQRMWHRPSGPRPRVYQYSGFWAADVRPVGEEYRVKFFKDLGDAMNQAIEYAKETGQ